MKRLILFFCMFLVVTDLSAQMVGSRRGITASGDVAIRFDGVDSLALDGASPRSLTTTFGTGTNPYAVVGVGLYFATAHIDSVTVDSLSGGVYKKCDSLVTIIRDATFYTGMYGKGGLDAGSHTFKIYAGASLYGSAGVARFFGVSQSAPIVTTASGLSSPANPSLTISNASGNWTVGVVGSSNTASYVANQTLVFTRRYSNYDLCMEYLSTAGSAVSWTEPQSYHSKTGIVLKAKANE